MATSQRLSRGFRRLAIFLAVIPLLAMILCHSPPALADRCMDDCMRECDGDRTTCRFECQNQCRPRPQTCDTGFKECFRTGLRPHCCPESTNCCPYRDRATLQQRLDCCGPGQVCCENIYSGCFDPSRQQCTASGIWDCPSDRALCRGVCCESGEVCTAQGCAAPEQSCHGQRCAPGEECTPIGCCPPTGCREPTCERDIQCADPSKIPEGTWPACYCQSDPPENSQGGGSIIPGEGYHPGLGGVANCNAMFVCPPRHQMEVGEGDVCICK